MNKKCQTNTFKTVKKKIEEIKFLLLRGVSEPSPIHNKNFAKVFYRKEIKLRRQSIVQLPYAVFEMTYFAYRN